MSSLKRLTFALLVAGLALCGPMGALAAPPPSSFLQVRNGHLYKDGKRLRLWGINIHGPSQGSSYEKVDANVRRIKAMGFNAVRLWGGRAFCEVKDGRRVYKTYKKGDRSALDLMDYCIARLKEEGLIIWLTWLDYHAVTPADVDLVSDPETREAWLKAVKQLQEPRYRLGGRLIFYFDPRAKEAFKDHIRRVLEHVNQYTNLAIKDDPAIGILELDNELQFMDNMLGIKGKVKGWGNEHVREVLPDFFYRELRSRWNQFLRQKYGSTERLLAAWGKLEEGESLEEGTVELQPCYANAQQYPQERGADIVRFYRQLFWEATGEYVGLIRRLGCKVPLILHTIASVNGLHIAYSNSPGDAIAYGNYWMQYADEPRMKKRPPLRYPWYTFIEGGPGFPFIHPYKQEGKPLLLYEINCFRSDKFRAEFPLLHAICGSWSDLDGIFFYIWDYGFSRDEERLANDHLYYPTTDHGWHGVITYSDEIFLATCRTAGQIFLHGYLRPPQNPTVVRYGREDLDNIRQHWYGVLHRIYPTALRYGLQIAFDPRARETKIIGDTVREGEAESDVWRVDDRLLWDREQGFLKLDLPSAKAAAGFLPPELEFKDGVKLEDVRKLWFDPHDITPPKEGKAGTHRPYYCFVLVSEDGMPLAKSKRVVVSLVSTSQNAGFVIDPSKIPVTGPDAAKFASGILSPWMKPVLVNRVGGRLVAPSLAGMRYRKLDFSLRAYEEGTMKGTLAISPTDPLFICEFVR